MAEKETLEQALRAMKQRRFDFAKALAEPFKRGVTDMNKTQAAIELSKRRWTTKPKRSELGGQAKLTINATIPPIPRDTAGVP